MVSVLQKGCKNSPVVIGGIGGSGTRLIAQILHKLGFYIGEDLNTAFDNLWFTLLFKKEDTLSLNDEEFSVRLDIFLRTMSGNAVFTKFEKELIKSLSKEDRPQHSVLWLQERAQSLLTSKDFQEKSGLWGWKEPNTHIVLDRLQKNMPALKYIHVIRSGLDMAYSTNQNQLAFWGKYFISGDFEISPYYSLKYWCIIHRKILKLGSALGSNLLLLNYDKFCTSPAANLTELLQFLNLEVDSQAFEEIIGLIIIAESTGRFRQYTVDGFDNDDIEFVRSLGFNVE